MRVANKFRMFSITVSDVKKSKAFYVDKLGLEITQDYRQDDDNWWITMEFPGGGASMTIAKAARYGADEPLKPGMAGLYFETTDVEAAHADLSKKGIKVSKIQDDLFGPGSDVRFFSIDDPDGNSINILQA